MSNFKPKQVSFDDLNAIEKDNLLTAIRRGASRRDVLKMMGALGVTSAAAATGIFAGAKDAWAQTPKRGGRLVIAHDQHGPNDTLDPQLYTSTIDYTRGRMFYGSLVRLGPDLVPQPELAEAFEVSSDGKVWTFDLKKGVTFHDGSSMGPDDVVWTMSRHLGKESKSKAGSLVDYVTEWKKSGPNQVQAILESPNVDLPTILGTFHFKILKKDTTDFSKTVGTGPYRIKEFKPGVRSIGTPFEDYWGEGGYLDEIEMFGIGDPVARLNAFLNGDIQVMGNVTSKAIPQVESADGREIFSVPSGAYINIAARRDMAPGNNNDLVLALKHLMDRERVVKGVLKGQGGLGNDQPIGPAYADHCSDIPQRALDPEKAKFHLKKSGHTGPIEIVAAEVAPGSVEQALFLQREAKKIGLDVQVKKVTSDGYWGAVWLKAPLCVVSWNMRPTANVMMSLAFKGDAKWNETFYKSDKFDDLLVKSRAVTDPGPRKQMYCDMQEIIHNEYGCILPAHRNYVDGIASNVKGIPKVPLNAFGGAELPVGVWLDS